MILTDLTVQFATVFVIQSWLNRKIWTITSASFGGRTREPLLEDAAERRSCERLHAFGCCLAKPGPIFAICRILSTSNRKLQSLVHP